MVAGGDLGLRRGTDSALGRFTCIEDLESSLSTTYAAARASPLPGVIALIHIAAHHHWAFTITSGRAGLEPAYCQRHALSADWRWLRENECDGEDYQQCKEHLCSSVVIWHSRPLV